MIELGHLKGVCCCMVLVCRRFLHLKVVIKDKNQKNQNVSVWHLCLPSTISDHTTCYYSQNKCVRCFLFIIHQPSLNGYACFMCTKLFPLFSAPGSKCHTLTKWQQAKQYWCFFYKPYNLWEKLSFKLASQYISPTGKQPILVINALYKL